ncbi:MAG: bifunctional riboflavin kinase/FAD synthetase [Acidobacteria bacterium]|nr:bifunctional riboflavin kinase/FAD synthetase [Acidobacteriota bacterium]MCG2816979.1 bifunctional riboflavin kinase/FAD synthetase [Candidatus Aminicenantes bacterium]MBU1338333.1 bifunctional riboflavin kinase/FAD synthetase [Acidobacteriota bacterium]MBU1473418.1 bifunctional riboflavin kinase/FAD synthetase [Acidobacteriota bacterium]MBU4204122.1 bifunctional riboflavin kinase/FAD synthetase [Acidobacteriota bacterium]
MNIFRGLDDITPVPSSSVIAAGNFDGVHLGHQRILSLLKQRAAQRDMPSYALTFSPHPRQVLEGTPLPLIQTLEQRLERMEELDIQNAVILEFNERFSRIPAGDFIQHIIARSLHAREIIVGRNFSFGRNRDGDVRALRLFQRRFEYRVFSVPSVLRSGVLVSSSNIRRLLWEGRMPEAARLLGRPYRISGPVIPGHSKGRKLGFPTANIQSVNGILPRGVFITETDVKGSLFPSITNIGSRPTFDGEELSVETHLIGENTDLYEKSLTVLFHQKIREEIRFDSIEALTARIETDISTARAFFDRLHS